MPTGLNGKVKDKMSVFKKVSLMVLCLILLVCVFAACDNSGDNSSDTSAEPSIETSAETSAETSVETSAESSSDTETDHVHEWGEWKTALEATCTTRGEERRDCKNCDQYETQGVKATGHNYTAVVTAPTCTEQGYTIHTCDCGDSYKDTYVDAAGHSYDSGKITTQATCVQNGQKKYTCTVATCNYSYTEPYALATYTATEIYNKAVKYVGEITTYDKKGSESSIGTCFVYSSDGKLITNYHVIDGAYSAKVNINGTTYTVASVLAYDADIDLAVLKINATGLDAATVCNKPVQVGSTVYAIGSSRGLTNTYSQGIITYADRVVNGISYVQHDASITHGNSGGPLINSYGEVIGINTWGISDSQNLNFAVFTDELDNLVYGTPLTVAEFYEQNKGAYEKAFDWLLEHYNSSNTEYIRFNYWDDNFLYALTYDIDDDYLYIDLYFETDSGASMYVILDLDNDPSQYVYYATYTQNGYTNQIIGKINANTFTNNTTLTYTDYSGTYFSRDWMMEYYRLAMNALISWFDWATLDFNMGICIGDLGFVSYS